MPLLLLSSVSILLIDHPSPVTSVFYGLRNASRCFHNAVQLGGSIHHWPGESLLIGWRADRHSPAEGDQASEAAR